MNLFSRGILMVSEKSQTSVKLCQCNPPYHVDHSFNLVVCDVLLDEKITRVRSTFTELFDTTPENDHRFKDQLHNQ